MRVLVSLGIIYMTIAILGAAWAHATKDNIGVLIVASAGLVCWAVAGLLWLTAS